MGSMRAHMGSGVKRSEAMALFPGDVASCVRQCDSKLTCSFRTLLQAKIRLNYMERLLQQAAAAVQAAAAAPPPGRDAAQIAQHAAQAAQVRRLECCGAPPVLCSAS